MLLFPGICLEISKLERADEEADVEACRNLSRKCCSQLWSLVVEPVDADLLIVEDMFASSLELFEVCFV